VFWCICASCGIATNNAADCACCEVVAAEELDLLLGFGKGGSHGVGRLWIGQAGGMLLFKVERGYRPREFGSCSSVQGMLGWSERRGGVEEYKINSLQTRDGVV
jgi:hypothetical protein